MSLDTLARVVPYGGRPPSTKMQKYAPTGEKVGRLMSVMFGMAQDFWVDRVTTIDYNEEFDVPDNETGKTRRVVAWATLGLSTDQDQLDRLARTMLDSEALLHDIATNRIRSTIIQHFQDASGADLTKDPVFPRRSDCRTALNTQMQKLGLRIEGSFQIGLTPYVRVSNEVIEIKDFQVTPKRGSGRQSIHLVATLDAPASTPPSTRFLRWLENQMPVRGQSGSIEKRLIGEIRGHLDNAFTTQELRRSPDKIAEMLTPKLDAVIGAETGFRVALNIFEQDRRSETYNYAGTHKIEATLLGTGRDALFEIDYVIDAFDETKFEGAFDKDAKAAANKAAAGSTLSPAERAAQSGDISTWAHALVQSIAETQLKRAITEMDLSDLPRIGLLPKDPKLSPDERVNALMKPTCERLGFEATIRTQAVVDRRLHQLRNGISVDTGLQDFDLAETTLRPKLRFKFDVFLPDGSESDMLNQYFQSSSDDHEPFAELKKTLSDRAQNVAATGLVHLTTNQYLDMTGDTARLRTGVEDSLSDVLRNEFGLTLRPPLAVQTDPDKVQEIYNDLRSEIRTAVIPINVVSDHTGDKVELELKLSYQVDRLANPNLTGERDEEGRIDAWERFRNMALKHGSVDGLLTEFEKVMAEAVRGRLESIPSEAFNKDSVLALRPQITETYRTAGEIFGLHVRVFEGTVNIDKKGGGVFGGTPRLERQRKRILRLENKLDELEERHDELRFGNSADKQGGSFLPDEEDEPSVEDEIKDLRKKIDEVEYALEEEQAKFELLKTEKHISLPRNTGAPPETPE